MILIALGANLPAEGFKTPKATLEAALAALAELPLRVTGRSRWYRSRPVPPSGQPDFINAAAALDTTLSPQELLAGLHGVEARFGRRRSQQNAARTLDLDLLAYGERIIAEPGGLQLPHPRLQDRGFVLLPLLDIAPGWCHPVSGESLEAMLARLSDLAGTEPIEEA